MFRPSGQASLASLQLSAAGTNLWQHVAAPATLVTRVDGAAVITLATDGSQTWAGGLSLAKGLSVGGNASVAGTLGVIGASLFSGGVTVAAPLTQTGTGNAVSLAGPFTLDNSLTQTGTGAVSLAGPVFAAAAVQLSGTLTQVGSGNVSIAGPTVHTNTLAVSGNFPTSLGGTLSVAGVLSCGPLAISGVDANLRSLVSLTPSASTNAVVVGQSLATNMSAVLQYTSGSTSRASVGVFNGSALTIDGGGNVTVPGQVVANGAAASGPIATATTTQCTNLNANYLQGLLAVQLQPRSTDTTSASGVVSATTFLTVIRRRRSRL